MHSVRRRKVQERHGQCKLLGVQSRKLCGTKWIARMQDVYRGHVCDSSRGFNFDMCAMWSRQIFYGRRSLNKFDMPIVSDVLIFTGW